MKTKVGDWIEIEALHIGGHKRKGRILEVMGEGEHEHYRVRWTEDDHESVFFPGADAAIVQARERGRSFPARRAGPPARRRSRLRGARSSSSA